MSTVAMRKLEIVALKRDMNSVLECLGHAGCFQIAGKGRAAEACADETREEENGASRYDSVLDDLEELRQSLGLSYPDFVPEGTRLPGPEEAAALEAMRERASSLIEALNDNAESASRAREALEEASVFAGLGLPYRELDQLSFLTVRIGRVDPSELHAIRSSLGSRGIVIAAGRKGDIVAVSSKNGRFALDTELARAGFSPRQFSQGFKGVPPELPAALERELAELDSRRTFLEREKDDLREELELPWRSLAASFAVASSVEDARHSLEASAQAYRLEGWAPKGEVGRIAKSLAEISGGRVALNSFSPRELGSPRHGGEEAPVLLKRRGFASSFERMVLSFGTPRYGSVDPTPFVCAFFILFFTVMFGDLGQGFLILVSALAIYFGLVPSLLKWKPFAPIGIACGIGSMVMGFLTGSFFTFESTLVPLTRAMSQVLFGHPVDRFLALMPEGGSGKILVFFGFTLALGVIVNSVGLVINIIGRIRAGETGEALFSKTGLAGALFFWWAVAMGVRAVLGSSPAWFDALGLGLPLLGLVFEERLIHAVEGAGERGAGHQKDGASAREAAHTGDGASAREVAHTGDGASAREVAHTGDGASAREVAHTGDGAFAGAVKGFVAILEALSYFLSNSLSFLRVGAFALSHVVLSFIVFTMGDMVRQRSAAGFLGQIVIVIFGNAIILFLEGLIVAIQIVRLEYYEFLSKFLTETGSPFIPFKFQFRKEQP